jgi:hypothetical protein
MQLDSFFPVGILLNLPIKTARMRSNCDRTLLLVARRHRLFVLLCFYSSKSIQVRFHWPSPTTKRAGAPPADQNTETSLLTPTKTPTLILQVTRDVFVG